MYYLCQKINDMTTFNEYNRENLFNVINKISIEKVNEQVLTKFDGKLIKVANVSNRYEVFDIAKYLKDKIELIEANFDIDRYKLEVVGGRQYLKLVSDKILIGGVDFYKSFYILNSSDKSRRLSFNVGLYSEESDFHIIGVSNIGMVRKHLTGVTKSADEATENINDETFGEQIDMLNSIVGHKVAFSKLREIIIGDAPFVDVPKINHKKFDAFKNSIRHYSNLEFATKQRELLFKESSKITEIEKADDFYLDAFWVLREYLKIFKRQDSHIIKTETERIMKITQCSVRNSLLESLGI
jgi:hypothetical protein